MVEHGWDEGKTNNVPLKGAYASSTPLLLYMYS
jgi:hypothetical protein